MKMKKSILMLLSLVLFLASVAPIGNAKEYNGKEDIQISASADSIYQVVDEYLIKKLSKTAKQYKKTFEKQNKDIKLEKKPYVMHLMGQIWVYYTVVEGAEHGFFGVGFDSETHEYLYNQSFLAQKIDGKNRILQTKEGQTIADFYLNDEGIVLSGWVISGTEKVSAKEIQDSIKNNNNDFTAQGFWSCFENCYENLDAIPQWIKDGIALTCGTSCAFGANPVCLGCLAVYAGIYAGELTACAWQCA